MLKARRTTCSGYVRLIELSKTFNLGFHLEFITNDSLKLSNHETPWSIKEPEAKILFNLVLENKIQKGFEIATAFGISSAIAGEALKITGGRLVTMDAYVEEFFNSSTKYGIDTKIINFKESHGYQMAKLLHESLKINHVVKLAVGWSPDNVAEIILENFQDNKLDYAFIDGGHSAKQVEADVNVILPNMGKDSLLVFHDFTCIPENVKKTIRTEFDNMKEYHTEFCLAAYSRGNKTLV